MGGSVGGVSALSLRSPEKEVIILRYEANCDVRHAERERGREERRASSQVVSPVSPLLPPLSLLSVTEQSWGVICFTHFDARPAGCVRARNHRRGTDHSLFSYEFEFSIREDEYSSVVI